jgi:hypothetical protein
MSDVDMPVPLGNSPKLPLNFRSPAHSTPRSPAGFNLSVLEPFGDPLAHQMVAGFLLMISSRSIGQARALEASTKRVFSSVAESYRPDWSADDWKFSFADAANLVRKDKSIKATTQNFYIVNGNVFAQFLQDHGTIPRFSLPAGVENAFLANTPKPAVSEIAVAGAGGGLPTHLIGADGDTVKLWNKLSKLTNISDPVVMHERLVTMLGHIRSLAVKGIRTHQAMHQAALHQISEVEHARIVRFIAENDGRSARSLGSGRGSRSAFINISSVLSYIEYEFGGMPPTRFEAPKFCRLLYNRFSVDDISRSLFLTTETAIYYLIIIILDTAMNVSSALRLRTDSMKEIIQGLHYRLDWYKKRFGEDVISDYFDREATLCKDRISVIEVVDLLVDLQKRITSFAIPSERQHLFLVGNLVGPIGSKGAYRVGVLSETLESKAWNRIRVRDPILKAFPMTLDMLRTSVLLLECLESNYNLFAVNRKAKHANYSTTIRYMHRQTVKSINVAHVREVQDFISAKATEKLPEVRAALGMSNQDAADIVAKARRKGFGSWATKTGSKSASKSKLEAPTIPANALEKWIVQGEKLFIADAEVAAEILAFRSHILREKPLLEPTPSWVETWAPLLLLLNRAIEAMSPLLRERGERVATEMDIFYAELD